MDWLKLIDITGLVLGLLYLWLEYRANIWLWAVGIIMPIVNSYLLFAKGLYADFGMEFYYVVIAIYGYYCWRWGNKTDKGKELPISRYKSRHIVASIITGLVLWGGIFWFLKYHTNSTVPILDSFTTAMSAVAMWALARKYLEQWLLWLLVDAVSCGLYIYKGIPFRAILYGVYTIIAILGYYKWRRLMLDAESMHDA
ncbi:MAG: nicotinamide mononucleotide transporter [Muribaculaceae bacterium]|nr:nicotinamide mononucleotide transporter [Muribaculaceae bacterium]